MQASKAADTYGLFEGHGIQQADAKQAYTQSKLGGVPTWVFLPRGEWPDSWKGMRNPVCPLILSLYGHPDSGGYWEQHCEGHVLSKGFIKCDPWRSCYFHPTHKLFLIIYVDDFKLSGPAGKLAEGWRLLKEPSEGCPKGIEMDDPTDVGRYLGCEHHVYTKSVEWHGELPTVLDPPPPKPKKTPMGTIRGVLRTKRGVVRRPSRLSHTSRGPPRR